jgi:hypothetical protein
MDDPHIGPGPESTDHDSDNQDELSLAALAEWGYVRAHFGDEPVLVTYELAAEIIASRKKQQ